MEIENNNSTTNTTWPRRLSGHYTTPSPYLGEPVSLIARLSGESVKSRLESTSVPTWAPSGSVLNILYEIRVFSSLFCPMAHWRPSVANGKILLKKDQLKCDRTALLRYKLVHYYLYNIIHLCRMT